MASLSSLLSLSSPYSLSKIQASSPRNRRHGVNYYVPCSASNNNGDQTPMNSNPNSREGKISLNMFDRRDVLFGLGGLYGAATFGGNRPALADPQIPDVTNCQPATIEKGVTVDCCPQPPFHEDMISEFVPPPATGNLRVRPAAHLITEDQLAKYEKAISLMKQLDKHDPRNFYQQADVHCAYCNNAYKQKGYDVNFEVHWNAMFFPFHRCYLYFFERICGHLIGDPDFAIPFWNWDSCQGMYFPEIYNNPYSPLYDEYRDARHISGKLLDLNYDGVTEDPSYNVVDCNIRWMHNQMMVDGKKTERFLGNLLRGGDQANQKTGQGTIERSPHNNVHNWVGNPKKKYHEDMGDFYSAGRDPVFYAHHGNVDRLWSIWRGLTDVPRDYNDCDWMDSSFVFYDEHGKAVRIRVEQCLKTEDLGYEYQDVEIQWKDKKQVPRRRPATVRELEQPAPPPTLSFPLSLDSQINSSVERTPSSGKELRELEEVLVIEDIEFDATSRVHFNVLINVLDDGADVCPGNLEFAGNFTNIPHGNAHRVKTSLQLVITEAIQELGLVGNRNLAVRIDPKVGGDKVTIGGIRIELEPID